MISSLNSENLAQEKGFTLIELLILIAIIGIVVAASAPGMRSLIDNNQLSSYVNSIVGAARYAKSEAVFQNIDVTLDITGGREGGWKVSGGDANKVGAKPNAKIVLVGATTVIFTPDGSLKGGQVEVGLSMLDSDVSPRTVKIGSAGSISSAKVE